MVGIPGLKISCRDAGGGGAFLGSCARRSLGGIRKSDKIRGYQADTQRLVVLVVDGIRRRSRSGMVVISTCPIAPVFLPLDLVAPAMGAIQASEAKHSRSWHSFTHTLSSSQFFFFLLLSVPFPRRHAQGISLIHTSIGNPTRYCQISTGDHAFFKDSAVTTPSSSIMSSLERTKSESEVSMKDVSDEEEEEEFELPVKPTPSR